MSDKPQTEVTTDSTAPTGAPRKPKSAQPSFDDILASVDKPPEPPPVKKAEPREPRPEPRERKPAGPPSFDDILAKAALPDAPPSAPPPPRESRFSPHREEKPRAQQKKDDFKMPVVVRKIALPGSQGVSSAPAGVPAQAPDTEETAHAPRAERPPRPERTDRRPERRPEHRAGQRPEQGAREDKDHEGRALPPLAESVYAQPMADESGDFAALFAEQAKAPKRERLQAGSKVSCRLAHIGAEVAFLDMGGKGEGIIDLRELRNEQGEITAKEGDPIEGWVLSIGDGALVVTKSVPQGSGREVLQQALESGTPVEGVVTGVNKGGVEVDLGGTRAFCPASQIDVRFVGDLAAFVGQKLAFKVMELKGGNAVLSRRALLEVDRAAKAARLRETLEVGATLEGVVVGVRDFGAFVDLGGIEGMVHVSELSHARIPHAQDAVQIGQKVRVQVLRIDPPAKKGESEKIALSLKALEQDPWDAARPKLEVNGKLQGKVARLQPFGAFVELFPGVDGLVHVSALSDKRVNHPKDVVQEGEEIFVQIESIDDASKRVALRRITAEEFASAEPAAPRGGRAHEGGERGPGAAAKSGGAGQKRSRVGDIVDATVEKCEAFGVFVTWDGGAQRGLVPNGELGTERGSDNKRTTPVGTVFKAYVLEIDDRGRFRLSKTAAEAAINRAEYAEYQKAQKRPSGKGFGTLGDLLRAKLAQKD